MEYWPKLASGSMNLNVWAGVLHTTHVPSSTSCVRASDSTTDIDVDYHIHLNMYRSPSAQKSFSDLALTTSVLTLTVNVPQLTSPIDMSDCYSGDPTNISGLVAGAYTEGTICYNNQASVTKSFTAP